MEVHLYESCCLWKVRNKRMEGNARANCARNRAISVVSFPQGDGCSDRGISRFFRKVPVHLTEGKAKVTWNI